MKNSASSTLKIIFFKVKDNQAKIRLIGSKVQHILNKQKKILITVPNDEAAQYIDALLWRFPEESFIPHSIAQTPTKDWVVITTQISQNLNQAPYLLNLCPQISPIYHQFEEIYELYDETHPHKMESSQKRLSVYQAQNLSVLIHQN